MRAALNRGAVMYAGTPLPVSGKGEGVPSLLFVCERSEDRRVMVQPNHPAGTE